MRFCMDKGLHFAGLSGLVGLSVVGLAALARFALLWWVGWLGCCIGGLDWLVDCFVLLVGLLGLGWFYALASLRA